ncbi:MAG TPA: hypothetical protein VM144_10775 [Aestuariivirga sp.]|nr:hypothetical protein [Aestuariivirga sp.]
MAVYWITFRLEDNPTYSKRYKAFTDEVNRLSSKWWVEPSSFFVFESSYTIDQIATALKTTISTSVDLVVIGMPDIKAARILGDFKDQDIFELIPFIKKV